MRADDSLRVAESERSEDDQCQQDGDPYCTHTIRTKQP